MLETKLRTIDGVEYRVAQLGWKEGRTALVRLLKVVGPSVGEAFKLAQVEPGKKFELDRSVSAAAVGALFTELAQRLTEEDFAYLTDIMVPKTEVHRGGDAWVRLSDEIHWHFAGDYWRCFKWLAFCLEVNYLGFFEERGGLGSWLGQVRTKASASPSPSTSTGVSTEFARAASTTSAH